MKKKMRKYKEVAKQINGRKDINSFISNNRIMLKMLVKSIKDDKPFCFPENSDPQEPGWCATCDVIFLFEFQFFSLKTFV